MPRRLKPFALAGLLICATGCATRTVVLDSQSDVVRLDKVSGTVFFYRAGEWVKSGKVKLPAGWWAGPGPAAP